MKLVKQISKLCTPAMLYFVLSIISFILMAFQNMSGDQHKYCLGTYSCQVENKPGIFIFKLVYILFILTEYASPEWCSHRLKFKSYKIY